MPVEHHSRRSVVKQLLAGGSAVMASPLLLMASNCTNQNEQADRLKGNINHSVCRGTFRQLGLEELCRTVKQLGFSAIDLVGPKDWPVLKSNGIYSSMCNGAEISLTEGWNDPQYHDRLVNSYLQHIDLVAKAGYKNLICFSGSRRGMDDETGIRNCSQGLQKIMKAAEQKGVLVIMELLNSKVDHKDYMCDHTAWGVELCKRVGSANFKLLYDIYHMQINEGDVIRTIQDNHAYLAHYHTAGVPGRHEIDDTQELNYTAICNAIKATGHTGYVAQEFTPLKPDKVASLRQAIRICDV